MYAILFVNYTSIRLWPPHAKSWLIGKDSGAGRHWGQEEKGTTEDEMAGWHHRLDGCEFEWTLGDADGQGGLACCDSGGRKELDTSERLNWTELKYTTLDLSQKAKKLSAKNAMRKINFSCFWCFYIKIYSYIKIVGLWVFLFNDSLYVIFFSHSEVSTGLEKLVLF